ncbi:MULTISPECIES: HAD-IA family hydrolase [unclassified Frankia]|uniref:HAD-IA family hydrolase n=1 Tax=unclassified Frankia TaxID=2632575 RepID=UPI001EF7412C|nr:MULTISPECIES: HAD-IA family hydrolase [unclassified Frankia]
MFGLPERIRAYLFDLDGVLTQTATVHAAAWKEMFDTFLRRRSERDRGPCVPFSVGDDYPSYVDGKPRADGIRSFLAARHIELPEGGPEDPSSADTVYGLGKRKNELVTAMIRDDGVAAYPGSVRYLRALVAVGAARAVVSSSTNCAAILTAAGLDSLVVVRIDGIVAEREQLAGKPAPDTFLAGARALGVAPSRAAVFEDAIAGVEAGRAGGFGYVVGIDRAGHADALRAHGADVVVADLADLLDAGRGAGVGGDGVGGDVDSEHRQPSAEPGGQSRPGGGSDV